MAFFLSQEQVARLLLGKEVSVQNKRYEVIPQENKWELFPDGEDYSQLRTIAPVSKGEWHITANSKNLIMHNKIRYNSGQFYFIWNPDYALSEVLLISPTGEYKSGLRTNMFDLRDIFFFSSGEVTLTATTFNPAENKSFLLFCDKNYSLKTVFPLDEETIYDCKVAEKNDLIYCITSCSTMGIQFKKIHCFDAAANLRWSNILPMGVSGYDLELVCHNSGVCAYFGNMCNLFSLEGHIIKTTKYDVAFRLISTCSHQSFAVASQVLKEKRLKKHEGFELILSSKESLYEITNTEIIKLREIAPSNQFWNIEQMLISVSHAREWCVECFDAGGEKLWSLSVEERLSCRPAFINQTLIFCTNLIFEEKNPFFVCYRVSKTGAILNRTQVYSDFTVYDIKYTDDKAYFLLSGISQCETNADSTRFSEWHFSSQDTGQRHGPGEE